MRRLRFYKFDEPLFRDWPEIVTLNTGMKYRYYNDKRQISGILYEPETPIHKIVKLYSIILEIKWNIENPSKIPTKGIIIG